MALAQVWNDNVHPHTETFKEKVFSIPPRSFIEMDYDEAVEFKCQFTPIKTDGEKNPLPESFKMIRVVAITKPEPTRLPLMCHATGKMASSVEELAKMNAEHYGTLDEDSRKSLDEAAAVKAENAELKARLAALETEKRGPGRPRKEA